MKRSPLPTVDVKPVRAIPIAARNASARSWRLSSGASVAITTMMLPLPSRPLSASFFRKDRPIFVLEPLADRHADDGELPPAASGVVVDQHADAIAAVVAGSTRDADPMPALKTECVHAGPGADAAARELSRLRRVEQSRRRRPRVTARAWMSLSSASSHSATTGSGTSSPRPIRGMLLDHPTDDAVGRASDVERIGQNDRLFEITRLLDPVRSGHLAVAVEGEEGGRDLVRPRGRRWAEPRSRRCGCRCPRSSSRARRERRRRR